MQREVQEREEAVEKVRLWLDQSQLQLQQSQEELNSREKECRLLRDKLATQQQIETDMKVYSKLTLCQRLASFLSIGKERSVNKHALVWLHESRTARQDYGCMS